MSVVATGRMRELMRRHSKSGKSISLCLQLLLHFQSALWCANYTFFPLEVCWLQWLGALLTLLSGARDYLLVVWVTTVSIKEHSVFHITLQCLPRLQLAYQSPYFMQNAIKSCSVFQKKWSQQHSLVSDPTETNLYHSASQLPYVKWFHTLLQTLPLFYTYLKHLISSIWIRPKYLHLHFPVLWQIEHYKVFLEGCDARFCVWR